MTLTNQIIFDAIEYGRTLPEGKSTDKAVIDFMAILKSAPKKARKIKVFDYSDTFMDEFEEVSGETIEHSLTAFLEDYIRDMFEFDSWDNLDSYSQYILVHDTVYEIFIDENDCEEATNSHRILNWYIQDVTKIGQIDLEKHKIIKA